MLQIHVCVGNACQLKGSLKVIEALKELISKNHLENKVVLFESFCMGHCRRGVAIKIGDEYVMNTNVSNIEEIFDEYILFKL